MTLIIKACIRLFHFKMLRYFWTIKNISNLVKSIERSKLYDTYELLELLSYRSLKTKPKILYFTKPTRFSFYPEE